MRYQCIVQDDKLYWLMILPHHWDIRLVPNEVLVLMQRSQFLSNFIHINSFPHHSYELAILILWLFNRFLTRLPEFYAKYSIYLFKRQFINYTTGWQFYSITISVAKSTCIDILFILCKISSLYITQLENMTTTASATTTPVLL